MVDTFEMFDELKTLKLRTFHIIYKSLVRPLRTSADLSSIISLTSNQVYSIRSMARLKSTTKSIRTAKAAASPRVQYTNSVATLPYQTIQYAHASFHPIEQQSQVTFFFLVAAFSFFYVTSSLIL